MWFTHFCPDINECMAANGNCSQICTNTNGSYACFCQSGYALTADSRKCTGESMVGLCTMDSKVTNKIPRYQ